VTDLSPETRALLELGRAGDDPSDEAVSHNRGKLALKLGAGALGAGVVASSASSAWASGKLIALCAVLLASGAAVGVYALQSPAVEAPASPAKVRPEAVAKAPAPAAETEPVPPEATPLPQAARSTPSAAGTASVGARSIQSELELIRAAQKHLHRGDANAALALLAEHARRYPAGALSEELEASRVSALCTLGNVAGARAQAERFLRRSPSSPFAERVRASCSSSTR
jgi:hypothetical protein